MDGVPHLGVDQGLVSEVVVPGDELVSGLALAGVRHAVRANVRAKVDGLARGSEIIGEPVETGRLVVVDTEYDLVTGEVGFWIICNNPHPDGGNLLTRELILEPGPSGLSGEGKDRNLARTSCAIPAVYGYRLSRIPKLPVDQR